ncbi:ABC transporter substrate-binding protein [Haladaptatus sp. DYF46]|uniref:ABC transporter substrate-binding protein n=1 Tax=Haladaptatus sp. DYF46 TaxID=2886041 RepID=UPI001E561128|nr:ABC transporter substrate-binding protein [Haladaptatus sp. DYF46]
MSDRDQSAAEEQLVDDLDNVLPGSVDRRKFLHGSLGSLGAMMLAGCTDGGGNNQSTKNGGDGSKATFTTPWKKEPSWGYTHVAAGKGYWKDAGVPNVNATRGNGSDTEAQNIGVGNKAMGISSLTTALSVYPKTQDTEALNMSIMGLARGRPLLSLIWRKDQMKDRTDLAGKTMLAASGFAAATSEVYPNLINVDPSKVTIEEGTEEVAAPKLSNNQVQAIWGSIDLYPSYQKQVDAELGVTPLTTFGAFPGFPIWVNNNWFKNKENNVEFVSNMLTGYFKALKWGLINQTKYLDYLKSEVNPNLRTWTKEELVGQHSVTCAQAVTLDMKENGLGYFTEDNISYVLDNTASALVDNPDALPNASDLVDMQAYEKSEKVKFSNKEWNQLSENAGEIWSIFKKAESNN